MGADSISAVRERYLIFQLADRTYAVPISCVEEIIPVAELFSIPGAPAFLAGFLDIAGELVAVISLRRLLDLPDHECDLYTPLIILNIDSQKFAIEIDSVSRIADLDEESAVPLTAGCSLNDSASAVARVDGRVVVLLSPERLLFDQERKRLAELTDLARQRLSKVEAMTG